MRSIGVYLSSSVEGDGDELYDIVQFLESLNDVLVDHGTIVEVETDTDVPGPDPVASCDLFYLLVGDRVRTASKVELGRALRARGADGRPEVAAYFGDAPDAVPDADTSVLEALIDQGTLVRGLHCTHPTSVKLGMLLDVCRKAGVASELRLADGDVRLDGVRLLSLRDAPVYRRNERIASCRQNQRELLLFYELTLHAHGRRGRLQAIPQPGELEGLVADIERSNATSLKRLHRLEADLLALCVRVNEDAALTERTRSASRLIERGDYRGAFDVLQEGRAGELARWELPRPRDPGSARGHIAEERLRIGILLAARPLRRSVAEADGSFRRVCGLAMELGVETGVIGDYAAFLRQRGRNREARELEEALGRQGRADEPGTGAHCDPGAMAVHEMEPWTIEWIMREAMDVALNLARRDRRRASGPLALGGSDPVPASRGGIVGNFGDALKVMVAELAGRPSCTLPQVASVSRALADVLRDIGRTDDAVELYASVVDAYFSVYGPVMPDAPDLVASLGALDELGELEGRAFNGWPGGLITVDPDHAEKRGLRLV